MTILPLRDDADAARCASAVTAHLVAGGILAYPTETVYGLGTALEPDALERLARLKGREGGKPFLLLDADPQRLPGLHWTPAALLLANRFWPGPLTLALLADNSFPASVQSPTATVAIRDTAHGPLRALLQQIARPITSTSANLAGGTPASTLAGLQRVLHQLAGGAAVLVLDGGSLPASLPSTVVDCSGNRARLVREGAIPLVQLSASMRQLGFAIDVG